MIRPPVHFATVSSAPFGTSAYSSASAMAAATIPNNHVRNNVMKPPPIQKM